MTTAQKRKHFIATSPKQFEAVQMLIESEEWRSLDALVNDWNDPKCLAYVITLLCDELVEAENRRNDLTETD
jgi:hypothetical protein